MTRLYIIGTLYLIKDQGRLQKKNGRPSTTGQTFAEHSAKKTRARFDRGPTKFLTGSRGHARTPAQR